MNTKNRYNGNTREKEKTPSVKKHRQLCVCVCVLSLQLKREKHSHSQWKSIITRNLHHRVEWSSPPSDLSSLSFHGRCLLLLIIVFFSVSLPLLWHCSSATHFTWYLDSHERTLIFLLLLLLLLLRCQYFTLLGVYLAAKCHEKAYTSLEYKLPHESTANRIHFLWGTYSPVSSVASFITHYLLCSRRSSAFRVFSLSLSSRPSRAQHKLTTLYSSLTGKDWQRKWKLFQMQLFPL